MTPAELRELDAWIAEKVMGFKRGWWDCFASTSPDEVTCGKIWVPALEFVDDLKKPFHPTTDPAAAMMVLERCAENGIINGDFKLPVSIRRRGDLQWVVSENCEDAPEHEFCIVAEAPTLPLAISLFAKELFK